MPTPNCVTLLDVENLIANEEYQKMGTKMTVCLLTLTNGHEVIGVSGCVDPKNYVAEIGNRIARQKATDKVWALAGYALQCRIHEAQAQKETPA